MEGVVDHQLRRLYADLGGIDVCVTEFVRVSQTLLPAKVFLRLCPELIEPISVPVRVQLLGSEPALLAANAYKAAMMGAPAIDLNFGCPAKTVNKHRGGACLLQEPELLYQIVRAVRDAVPAATPVTAKVRLGFDERSHYVENAQAIEAAGAAELVVHARSKDDGYRPPAYWECIAEIRQAVSLPVIANGEIWSVADFERCRKVSGCEDFMLGRGLLARPDLALAIRAHTEGRSHSALDWLQILSILQGYFAQSASAYPGKYCGNRLKQWLMYLQRQYPQAQTFFESIKRARDPQEIHAAFAQSQRLCA